MDELSRAQNVSVAGMKAQAERLRIVAQNLANAESVGERPGEQPYRRQVITFQNAVNRQLGIETVEVNRVRQDMSPFPKEHNPDHPAADANGYVMMPNVNPLIELMDLHEAQRSYEANMNSISVAREMSKKTLELLR